MTYLKRYATVVRVDLGNRTIVVSTDGGERLELHLRWRCGWGSTGSSPTGQFDFGRGTRVKVYQRPQDNHPKFRRQGS